MYEPPFGTLQTIDSLVVAPSASEMSPFAVGRIANKGALPPWALETTINPSATKGVGMGMSPPLRKRHNSLPFSRSYETTYGQPLVTTWVRAPSLKIKGEPQLPSDAPLRDVLQSSFPLER